LLGYFLFPSQSDDAHQDGPRERTSTNFVETGYRTESKIRSLVLECRWRTHVLTLESWGGRIELLHVAREIRHDIPSARHSAHPIAVNRLVALVPIKDFRSAKGRLRSQLGDEETSQLARALAHEVLTALQPLPVLVVTDDLDVAEFAAELGARVHQQRRSGLNAAVSEGYLTLGASAEHVVVVHSDLAQPAGLGSYPYADGVAIWTDHAGQGTNVLSLPAGLDFTFAYGEGSAPRHRALARELGFEPQWITESPWALDIDEPSDLPGI